MKIVVFGLSVSSSWGNGHATLWRGLIAALARRGHRVAFFERDVPYYAQHRDLTSLEGGELVLYSSFDEVLPTARAHLADADVAMVTSYCPDSAEAAEEVLGSRAAVRAFYDLDAPVTIERTRAGERVPYVPPGGFRDFDLVLSYTGGGALDALRDLFGARLAVPLYGSVDPAAHFPIASRPAHRAGLSYLGTYSPDRQAAVHALFLEPARRMPQRDFVIGGAMYPHDFPWLPNIRYLRHVAPPEHPAFYGASRLTLNVTRAPMAALGYCPSARLFEAAACGTPLLTDTWDGLEAFFRPGHEILTARDADAAVAAISHSDEELDRIARAARDRTLSQHTADRRAAELEEILSWVASASPRAQAAAAEAGGGVGCGA